MVQLLLEGLHRRVAEARSPITRVSHVNARVSAGSTEIGTFQPSKLLLLIKYCFAAVRAGVTGAANCFYYVPAPGKRSALYRDWIVLTLCRPFYRTVVFHWHGVGLADWLESEATSIERRITVFLLGSPSLSIVLSDFGRRDAEIVRSRKIAIVPNGIPDPCPDYSEAVLPARTARAAERRRGDPALPPSVFRLLFLASCTEEKGLFAALEATALANRANQPIHVHLTVAGDFGSAADRQRFEQRIAQDDLRDTVAYAGFVGPEQKTSLLRESDALLFPSLYSHEGQPVTVIEALAHGLPVIATRWRSVPELLDGPDAILVDGQDSAAIAEAICTAAHAQVSTSGRERFLSRYSVDRHLEAIEQALISTV